MILMYHDSGCTMDLLLPWSLYQAEVKLRAWPVRQVVRQVGRRGPLDPELQPSSERPWGSDAYTWDVLVY